MRKLLIHGASGHGCVVADAAVLEGAWTELLATDRNPSRCVGDLIVGVRCVAQTDDVDQVHIAIGAAVSRKAETEAYSVAFGASCLVSVVHPQASVSSGAHIERGCFIAAGARIGPNVKLGRGVIVNHNAVVDHDCVVDEFSHIAPGAVLGGDVKVGKQVLIGAGAVILPGLTISDHVVVGAGAVVCRSLAGGRFAGVPARAI